MDNQELERLKRNYEFTTFMFWLMTGLNVVFIVLLSICKG